MKALLIILPKRSLIECRQCYRKRNKQTKKKQREDKAQKGNKVKASWGPTLFPALGLPSDVTNHYLPVADLGF